MPDVVQQAGEARHAPGVVEVCGGEIAEARAQAAEALASQMHHAQGMLEAVVHRAGIDQIDEAELADVAQALHPRMIDDLALNLIDDDGAVDRIADLVGGRHGSL